MMTDHNQLDRDFIEDSNTSNNPEFSQIIAKRMSRRTMLKGGTGLTAAAFFGTLPLTGCGSDNNDLVSSNGAAPAVPATADLTRPKQLNFSAVSHSLSNDIVVADGYNAEAILHVGTPLKSGIEDWKDNREQSGESFEYRMGDNHDGMWFFGKKGDKYDPKASDNALLAINHEYTNDSLNPLGFYTTDEVAAEKIYQKKRLATDVRRECNAHGVAIVEMKRRSSATGYDMVKDSKFNKRYTSASEVSLVGPAAGSDYLKTKYDPTGNKTRGINNQCGAGLSPWGTFLTTEENFLNVFARGADKAIIGDKADFAMGRYGLKENGTGGGYLWHTPPASDAIIEDEFARWSSTASATVAGAHEDYRNAFNTFGYIVEIDPFSPTAKAVKRTALGRFAHENCAYAPVVEGKPVVMYMGDDARGEYIYKFVSANKWSNADIGGGLAAGAKYLDNGTLYVAVFNDNGIGEWKPLVFGQGALTTAYSLYAFANQADVLVHARIAGDALGATKMDRPEWVSVSPVTGEVYVTLTNNSNRGVKYETDAANPRNYADNKGNRNGHIIRWAENNGDHAATSFNWDIYLFASPADLTAENLSGLTANNDLSSPDGLYFDPRGVLWIQTDDGAYTDTTNCMLLAALPGKVNDGKVITTSAGENTRVGMQASESNIKRFFVGPKCCEVTGITLTPDFKTLFINIQHPGEGIDGVTWGAIAGGTTPRAATVMITKKDGGVILGESL